MQSTTDTHLLFLNVMRITEGHLDEFKHATERAVEFVEQHGPQLMVQTFIDEEQLRAYSFQLYPNSDAIRAHWTMSDPYIRGVMAHCTVERLDIYGEPDADVLRELSTVGSDDLVWKLVPRQIGFLRTSGAATDSNKGAHGR